MIRQKKIRIWLCLVSCLVAVWLGTVSSHAQEEGGQITTNGNIEFLPEDTSSSTLQPDKSHGASDDKLSDGTLQKKPIGRLPSTGERIVRYGGFLVAIGALGFVVWTISRKRGEQ